MVWSASPSGATTYVIYDTANLTVKPTVDDTGVFSVGDGTTDMDFKVYVGQATDFALFDIGAGQLTLDNMELNLGDGDELEFGDGAAGAGDVYIAWDGTDLDMTAAVDDSIFKIGTGTVSFDVWVYGNIPTSYLLWDASQDVVSLLGPVRPAGFNCLSRRLELKRVFAQENCGHPRLNSAIDTSIATHVLSDPDFEVLGVGAGNTSTAIATTGGITMTTGATDGNEVILLPHLNANQTAWQTTVWPTDNEVHWEAHIATNANVTNEIIWAGLKLTNTEVGTTDANCLFFRYEDDVASSVWQVFEAIANADTITNTAITVAVNTQYHLKIMVASDRTAQCYINGALVRTTAALTTGINLIPYIGVAADGANAAKKISVFGTAISRLVSVSA